jgi:hypothetical protein
MDIEQAYKKCTERLMWACASLQATVEPSELALIADLIVQPMTGPWRFFHTPQHIFKVGGTEDPIEVLAALFHDLVYVQVDCSINFQLSYYITAYTKEVKGQLLIREPADLPADLMFEIVASVFGFVPGEVLQPFAGQNEFLSALVAVKVLERFLQPEDLIQIVAGIEATIPFRSTSEDGLTVSDRLFKRLQVTRDKFNLCLSDSELSEAVKKAVRVSNRDVTSFAHPNPAHFLANTWNLLPETNHNLINCSYTVRDYRIALQKMEGFMNFLRPDVIFRQYRGEPSDRIFQLWDSAARRNLEIAKLYLGSKLVAIAFIEALSSTIGPDVPLVIMMGNMPNGNCDNPRLENYIPVVANAYQPQNDLEREVMNLLEKGRAKSAKYDLEHSPLATFMVKSMGFEEIRCQCNRAKAFFKEELTAEDFIGEFEPTVAKALIDGVVKLFDTHKNALTRMSWVKNRVLWESCVNSSNSDSSANK